MKRNQLLVGLTVVLSTLGCGSDGDSRECGPGTTEIDGVCTGDADIMCTGGTKLNADGTACEVDPASCQDGTVLVDGACVDPGHVTADVEEAMEPNGLGLFGEASAEGAGDVVLKPVGQSSVIHGKIVPFQDVDGDGQTDPDVDTYLLEVTAPTMLTVSADGLHGLAAGFLSAAAVDAGHPLEDWTRFGLNLTGDTSQRSLYLPVAGLYILAVADTRTLFLTGAAAAAATGAPAFEYYVTVNQATATASPLTVTDGVATSAGMLAPGEVKLFTVPMGLGINSAELEVPADQAIESIVVVNTTGATSVVKAAVDGDAGVTAADVAMVGFKTGDTTIVVADHVYNYAHQPVTYGLTVTTGTAAALPTDGTAVTQPANDTSFSTFYYDVAAALEIRGMNITFNVPVTGAVVNEQLGLFAFFTFDPDLGFSLGDTFTSYKGLLRHPAAGRYYFVVFDPNDAVTQIQATSAHAAVTPGTVVKGTPLTNQAITAFESNPFSYAAGAEDAWQQFNATGTNTGNLVATFFNPANVTRFTRGYGFGRLDALASSCVVGATDFCADVTPIFAQAYPATGAPQGRVLLGDGTTNYLLTVNTATVTGGPTFNLDFTRRPHTDLGAAAIGTQVTADNQPLDGTVTVQRYLLRATAGYGLTVNVSPDQGTLDTRIQHVNSNESARGALVNNGIAGADDIVQIVQNGEGFTAFTVTSTAPIAGGTFDLTIDPTANVTYTAAAGATAFSDACAGGGTAVAMNNTDEGSSVANVNTPAGFRYFGFASPQIKVFSNGFASVVTSTACTTVGSSCFFTNGDLPNAASPNGIIAPYWDDLVVATVNGVCQKVAGTKLIIQWTGTRFNVSTDVVSFQMILDGATNTVELVYGATHVPTGTTATIGLENQVGGAANKIGFNTAAVITPGASKLFTPN